MRATVDKRSWTYLDLALIAGALLPLVIFAGIAFFTYERAREGARADVRTRADLLRAHMSKLVQVNLMLLDQLQEHFDGVDDRRITAHQAEYHRYLANMRTRHPEVLSLTVIG